MIAGRRPRAAHPTCADMRYCFDLLELNGRDLTDFSCNAPPVHTSGSNKRLNEGSPGSPLTSRPVVMGSGGKVCWSSHVSCARILLSNLMARGSMNLRRASISRNIPLTALRALDIRRRRIKRGAHESVKELIAAIGAFIKHQNDNPKPLRWTKSADDTSLGFTPPSRMLRASGSPGLSVANGRALRRRARRCLRYR